MKNFKDLQISRQLLKDYIWFEEIIFSKKKKKMRIEVIFENKAIQFKIKSKSTTTKELISKIIKWFFCHNINNSIIFFKKKKKKKKKKKEFENNKWEWLLSDIQGSKSTIQIGRVRSGRKCKLIFFFYFKHNSINPPNSFSFFRNTTKDIERKERFWIVLWIDQKRRGK